MVKEIERVGITIVHCCSIIPISKTVGANRIVPTIAIPHPFGDPHLGPEEERSLRKEIAKKALKALATSVEKQTIFN
jgi:glycine reductase